MKAVSRIAAAAMAVHVAMCAPVAGAEQLTARAVVDKTRVFVGEPFTLQIQVSGSETPEKPDMSALQDFTVEELGGQRNSSRSVTMDFSGRVITKVETGFIWSYRLTAKREGALAIPPLKITAEGRETRTGALIVQAVPPAPVDNFELKQALSKFECYVGEAIELTVRWYVGQEARIGQARLPVLTGGDFLFIDPKIAPGSQNVRIPLAEGGEIVAERLKGRLHGKDCVVVQFKKVLIPKRPGTVRLEPASMVFEALMGYRKTRDRIGSRFFDDDFFKGFFDDDFFGGREGVYRTVVIASNDLSLRVKELPAAGKPANFAGHVGRYEIEASAEPRNVSVGDPITLKIRLRGPEYLEHVGLPPLHEQRQLTCDFKIPAEMAPGVVAQGTKEFTQTIRALRPDVTQVPPIELPYFEPEAGEYRVARSAPIPITVAAARVVTAGDAEGAFSPVAGSTLESWTKGIAHNYEDMSVIEQHRFALALLKPGAFLALVGIPPLTYAALLLGVLAVRARRTDPVALRRRRAFAAAASALRGVRKLPEGARFRTAWDALRSYLSDKLAISERAVSFGWVKPLLEQRGLDADTLEELRRLFEICEAEQYGGGGNADPLELANRMLATIRRLEGRLK